MDAEVLLTVATNAFLDIVWPYLPAHVLDALAYV